jgi:hypothetical protein
MSVAWFRSRKRPPDSPLQGARDGSPSAYPSLSDLEEVVTGLFCLIDDDYRLLNPHLRRYESLKRLSDSEVITLALLQKLRGVESQRSFLRDAQRFLSHMVPNVVGFIHPHCTAR